MSGDISFYRNGFFLCTVVLVHIYLVQFLISIKQDNMELPEERYLSLLRKLFEDSLPNATLDVVGKLEDVGTDPDLLLYRAAIQRLLMFEREYLSQIEQIWRNALAASPNDLAAQGDFVAAVMKMYSFRKYFTDAEMFLAAAEEAWLT